MTRSSRPPLAGSELDRDAGTRRSPERLDAAWAEPNARMLQLRDGEVLVVREASGGIRLRLARPVGERDATHLYLGRIAGAPIFAATAGEARTETDIVDAEPGSDSAGPGSASEASPEWASPFVCAAELPGAEAEALASALALSAWHRSMGFSPRDGSEMAPAQGGWVRVDARGEHFPRTDPVVITLIEHDGRLLLGSNALWESNRFSLLAGFIEAGESAEAAVAREVFEESGLRLANIRYVASQPWPFPRSLMLGFRAVLAEGMDPDALSPDPEEISELRWFTRGELRNSESLMLPRPLSIARWLIDGWIAETGRG